MSEIIEKVQNNEDYEAAPSGLYINKENELLPIFSIDIKSVIHEKFAQVQLIQKYYNPYDEYLDTSFKFPTGLYQVFDGIEVEMDGKKIKGLVGLKKEIRKNYITELAEGSTVIKAEEFFPTSAKIKNDLLITNIGNIPPKKEIKVIFSFLQTLDISLNKIYKFVLPLVLTPNFIPKKNTYILLKDYIHKENLNSKDNFNTKMDKIEFIESENNNKLNYYYNIDVTINSMLKIEKIETKMKDNKIIMKRINDFKYKVSLDPLELHIPNEDFVLEYEINHEYLKKPLFLLELHPKYKNDYFFYYSFNPTKLIDEKINENKINENFKGNFILLIDCSGSMHGNRINLVIKSLIYFLKSLKENGSTFNIICFGINFYTIFEKNKLVNDENINQALNLVLEFKPDMGKCELEKTLKFMKKELIEINLLNRVFIISDGEDYSFDSCLELIKDISHNTNFDCRFYCLGIGDGYRDKTIKEIAINGDGEYEIATNEEDISDKIIYLLDSSMNSCLDNFIFKLKNNDDKIFQSCKWSRKLNNTIEFYSFLNNEKLLKENSIICSFYYNKKKFTLEKKIELNKPLLSNILHKIFLKSYIDYLEVNKSKKTIYNDLELALKYQILSNKTSFYCLLQENNLSDEDLLIKKYKEIENIPPMDYLSKFGVKTLSGRFIELDYNSSYTILEIKKQIENKTNIPILKQRLVFKGKMLHDEYTLSYYNIPFYGILHLLLRPKGAGPEIKIKILYNNEEKFTYILKEEYHNLGETIIEMIKNIFKKIGINNNLNKYDFYVDETILLEEDFDISYYNKFHLVDKTLKIYNKEKMNISKEDKIIK